MDVAWRLAGLGVSATVGRSAGVRTKRNFRVFRVMTKQLLFVWRGGRRAYHSSFYFGGYLGSSTAAPLSTLYDLTAVKYVRPRGPTSHEQPAPRTESAESIPPGVVMVMVLNSAYTGSIPRYL